MRIFLKERLHDDDEDDYDGGGDERMLTEPILENAPTRTHVFYNKYSSLKDMVALMKNRYTIYIYSVMHGDTIYIYIYVILNN